MRGWEENFQSKEFFQKWNDIEKPKKKSEKRELAKVPVVQPNGTSWHKMTHVEQVEQVEAGLQIYVEQVKQEQGGLQIDVEQVEQGQGVCPAEPLHLTQSGTTRPWTVALWKWSSGNQKNVTVRNSHGPNVADQLWFVFDRPNRFGQNERKLKELGLLLVLHDMYMSIFEIYSTQIVPNYFLLLLLRLLLNKHF